MTDHQYWTRLVILSGVLCLLIAINMLFGS